VHVLHGRLRDDLRERFRRHADDADLQRPHAPDDVGRSDGDERGVAVSRLPRRAALAEAGERRRLLLQEGRHEDVRRQHRPAGVLLDLRQEIERAVVELVIAERLDVVADPVEGAHLGLAAERVVIGRPLEEVAGVEHEHVGMTGPLAVDEGGQPGEPADRIAGRGHPRLQPRVEVVRVEEAERGGRDGAGGQDDEERRQASGER
jgi:hypothetical protein